MPKKSKPKVLKDWDRRPWPAVGDANVDDLYASIGRTLSEWERYNGNLSLLFAAFISGPLEDAARRSYAAVRTFEGRLEMLRAASEAYFAVMPNGDLLEDFKDILRAGSKFAERRNEIAHGTVAHFI